MSLLLIAASPTAPSRSGALLSATGERLVHLGLAPQTLRLRELPAEALLLADAQQAQIREALQQVAQARAIVLATPIYKAAYSGLLKVFLDLLPQDGLRGKTILPLATGGSLAHLLALDYALKPVLSALGARDILDAVYATDAHLPRIDGAYGLDAGIGRRLTEASHELHERLAAPPRALAVRGPEPVLAERCSA
nr:NADPH-dependent FMN reductase [uncultured Roseateles sp.]